ncbi:PLP-dependent aminotransferase family protein [Rhodanobacter sp. DHG33]|uniref:MocR-like pyridoxine biosynthesis transcription factor PdxR n=1 Tax=Rhodanobacter sp. DHG33 TaxID=2775921 RepID=UPI001CE163DA|nr:PLP-dependent aminotransferase family protein [Rhodanobacter sp. DHG33]
MATNIAETLSESADMFLELDGHGPHYAQLARALREAVLDGRLTTGARLPPTRELARELELSRTTVLAAYEQLRAEGFIEGHAGSGSYVASLQTHPPLLPAAPTIEPPSRFAQRARLVRIPGIATKHRGLRYELQYGHSQINPALNGIWGRELARAAIYTPPQITHVQGLPALRKQICDYLAHRRGVRVSPEQVMVVAGTQQAVTIAARVLLDEGDAVALEEPHYFSMHQALVAHGARICPVRTDHDGLVCAELPQISPRLVCVTPSHQFPTGAVLSLPRRLELLRYAEKHQCWILEDDYDGEFRYDAHPLAALRSLDEGDRVIYVGTFSKVLFGTLRLAYMVLPVALVDDFVNAKYLSDVASPGIEQAALAHFMEDGGFERHLRLARKELQARREALTEGLRQYAGDRVEIAGSPAGMHVVAWLRGYDHTRAEALVELARERGLGLYSMTPHYLVPPARPGLLLGYCGLSVTTLREAMQLFGQCLDDMDARQV